MELGIIGFRMGANMTESFVLGGHRLSRKKRADTASRRQGRARRALPRRLRQTASLKVIAALRNEFGGHAVKKG